MCLEYWPIVGRWASGQPEGALHIVLSTALVETPASRRMAGSGHLVDLFGFPGPELLFPLPRGPREAGVRASPSSRSPQHETCPHSPAGPTSVCLPAGGGGKAKVSADPAAEKPSPQPQAWHLGTGHPPSPRCPEGDCNRRTPLTSRVWEGRPSSAGGRLGWGPGPRPAA